MLSSLYPQLTIVEKIFTRKLHVPTKHIVQLADPCDSPPSLTIKHLYIALLKIIQTDISEKEEQDRMRETLRKIEKSPAGNGNIITTTVEWLRYMDSKNIVSEDVDEIGVASRLIDWAVTTTICREDLDSNVEKLKILKSENTATIKTLRSGTPLPLIFLLSEYDIC